MNEIGYISIHRRILNWEWYSDIPVRLTFLHLLVIANWEEKEWKGIKIKRGQVVIGRKKLSEEIGISEQQLRTSLIKLKSSQQITIKPTNKFSVVTIIKYNDYQDKDKKTTNKKNKKQPTNNQQSTTTKESNKEINKNDIDYRLSEFKNSLQPFLEKYGSKMLNDFYLHWAEKNPNGKKMKFEKQQTFDVNLRLIRWLKNQKEWKKEKSSDKNETAENNLNKALGL